MSSLTPRPAYSDAEITRLYPPGLELRQVQILLRHGERTPVGTRFLNAGLPAHWPYCSAARLLRAAVLDAPASASASASFSEVHWRRRIETFARSNNGKNGSENDDAVLAAGPAGEVDGICDMGMLTDRGRETTLALGSRLRALYIDRLGFLPSHITSDEDLYLRATLIPRALESMQQTFWGLYPPSSRAPKFPPLTILSRHLADETLFPNEGNCRRFAELARAFARRAAERWNDSPEMDLLNGRIGRWMPPESPRVAVDSRPRLSGVMDTINASAAHGPATRLPSEFYDPEVKRAVERITTEEWFAGYKESREYRALGIGSLLGDITARMVRSAEGVVAPRFGLSGCHDTTLAGLLASLGAFETTAWPPFTSHIAVELFRSEQQQQQQQQQQSKSTWWPSKGIGRTTSSELSGREKQLLKGYFVRLRYNDEPVTIPGCQRPGNHLPGDETFCTLEAFKAIVDKFTPRNWTQECRANIKSSAFPSSDETAGF